MRMPSAWPRSWDKSPKPDPNTAGVGLERRRLVDWFVGGLLLAAVIATVAFTIGWSQVLAPWQTLGFGELSFAFLLTAASYFLRGVRIKEYFRPRLECRFADVLRLSVLHNAANNLLPMRTGEMVFPWLMGRYFGQGFLGATASLVWIRLLDLHFLGLLGLLILWLRDPSWVWAIAGGLWLALLSMLVSIKHLRPNGGHWIGRILRLMVDAAPMSNRVISRIYFWTALSWITKFLAFALVLQHFLTAELWQILVGVLGAELSSVLPVHGIAGSGSYELGMVAALMPWGVDAAAALRGAVNLHLFLLGSTLILGALALVVPGPGARGERVDSFKSSS